MGLKVGDCVKFKDFHSRDTTGRVTAVNGGSIVVRQDATTIEWLMFEYQLKKISSAERTVYLL